ncbi:MAG: hypothetical protein SOT19_03740 [Muribaculaceae bacterium]|nr:hypothetical protein [Muribaculaceae bacterium]
MRHDIERLTRLTAEMEGLLYVIDHRGDNNGTVHAALADKYNEFRSLIEQELTAASDGHVAEAEVTPAAEEHAAPCASSEAAKDADELMKQTDEICVNAFSLLDDGPEVEVAKEDEGVSGEVETETDAADAAISREEKKKDVTAAQEQRALEDIDNESHPEFSLFQASIPGLDERPAAEAKPEAKAEEKPAAEDDAFSFKVEFSDHGNDEPVKVSPDAEEPAKAEETPAFKVEEHHDEAPKPAAKAAEPEPAKEAKVEEAAAPAEPEPEKQKISVTINDVLSARPGELRLDEMLSRREARTLRKAFTLNDKFRFRRELFNGDDALFGRTLDAIQKEPSYDDAVEYLQEKLNWDINNPDVTDFLAIVRNHFNSL